MALLPCPLLAQEPSRRLQGTVTDAVAGKPIALANISLGGRNLAITDDSGRFDINLREKGQVGVLARRIGFKPVTVRIDPSGDTTIRVVLEPTARLLEATDVAAPSFPSLILHGFYDRLRDRERGAGTGHFLTPEDIEQRRALRATQLIENIPGVRIVRGTEGINDWNVMGASRCLMTIYLNGTRIINSLSDSRRDAELSQRNLKLDQVIEPSAIVGIEVYGRGASAPEKYRVMNGTCGVVLIWSK